MKKIFVLAAIVSVLAVRALAADAPTTVTGKMVCGKCVLHETKECQNVIQVEKDGKTTNYYLVQNDVSKAQHEAICGGSSETVTATGTVSEKDGKEIMTATKIEVAAK